MNRLALIFVCAVSLLGAYSQVPGTWMRDWQNAPNSLCSPDSFTVSNSSQTYLISYSFSLLSLQDCPNNTVNYTAGLALNISTGNWVDSNGQQLVYDSTNDAVQYLFTNSTPYLYDKNGSALPQQKTLGNLGGSWINPTPLGSATLQDCCVPDTLFIDPADQLLFRDLIYVLPSFTSSNCSTVNTTQRAITEVPSFQVANWTSIGYGNSNFSNYIFDPSNTTYLTLSLSNGSSVCGSYSYQKAPGVKLLNNTWYLDWQSQAMIGFVPTVYQVLSVDNAYMVTTLNYSFDGNIIRQSFLVQDLEDQYYDSSVGFAFTYNSSTETLLSIPSAVAPFNILYSLNGSYINNPLSGESYWDNPQSIDNSPIPTNCCTPYGVYLYPVSVTLGNYDIEYYLPKDYQNNPGCADFTAYIQNYTLTAGFYLGYPSTSNLNWVDDYGSQIYFTNTSGISELTFETFLGYDGCSFKVDFTTIPPSPPLFAVWMSIDIKIFIMMGIVMLLASF